MHIHVETYTTSALGRLAGVIIAAAAATAAPIAIAQEDVAVIEEIVVSAQKREEFLSDVPLSIQVTSGDFLDRNNIRNLREVANFVPGAATGEAFGTDNTRIQLRGVPQIEGDPTVGYYIGDTPFYFPTMFFAPAVRTSGLERIEIIKGPQSTLYGNGAMGGVIRVIPKQPDLQEFDLTVRGAYTTIDDYGDGNYVDASLSIPLIEDRLAIRASVGQEESGGWITLQPHALNLATFAYEPSGRALDDFGGTDFLDWRAQVLWTPTDRLTMEFMAAHNETETTPAGFLLIDQDISADANPELTYNDVEYDLFSASLSYDFDSITLTSVFSWLEFEEDWQSSLIATFGLPIRVFYEPETFSNETRIVSNFDGRFQFVAGIFYVDADREQLVDVAEFVLLGVPRILSTSSAESEQISVFGEATYELIEDSLTMLVGVRWFEDERSFAETSSILPIELPSYEETFDSINPRFNLAYTPDDNQLYYFNAAKGFRSGIFNGLSACISIPPGHPLAAACPETIDSDELWSYEVGTKQTLLDGGLILDASVYYHDWRDVQGAARLGSITTSFKLGDVDGWGVDLGVTWMPEAVPGLTLMLSANWNDMEFSSLDPVIEVAMAPLFRAGDGLPGTPPFSSTVGVSYGRQLLSNMFGEFTLSWNHKDGHVSAVGSTVNAETRNYVNMRFGLAIGDHFGVAVFGNNLTNEDAILVAQAGPLYNTPIRTTERPRTYGIELSYQL